MTYRQKLRDPRWQKVRLKIFERDDWKCRHPGCNSPEYTPLAVHHRRYLRGRDPWEYSPDDLITFCENCHTLVHSLATAEPLSENRSYAWGQLTTLLGFEPQPYLTERDGRIVCACVHLQYNPGAPEILLPGDTADIVARSQLFAGQENWIPVFIKAVNGGWQYRGRYRVEAATTNPAEIALHQRSHNLQKIPISMVLFLEKEPSRQPPT